MNANQVPILFDKHHPKEPDEISRKIGDFKLISKEY